MRNPMLRSIRHATFRGLFLQPEPMMRPGPIKIYAAGPHGLERAFHAERADVDVGEDERDEQHCTTLWTTWATCMPTMFVT